MARTKSWIVVKIRTAEDTSVTIGITKAEALRIRDSITEKEKDDIELAKLEEPRTGAGSLD